jgi:hypothetical protein
LKHNSTQELLAAPQSNLTTVVAENIVTSYQVKSSNDYDWLNTAVLVGGFTAMASLICVTLYVKRDAILAGAQYSKDTVAHTSHGVYRMLRSVKPQYKGYQPVASDEMDQPRLNSLA